MQREYKEQKDLRDQGRAPQSSERRARELLNLVWGHTSFRPGQWETIRAVIAGRDLLAVLPTGTGKSICFQLPSLMMAGIVVVVSPLIALMVDQTQRLRRRGISAAHISSTLSQAVRAERWRAACAGDLKMLYLAPEQLRSREFREVVEAGRLAFVAVDEAHCVSEWGDSFRPAYRTIRQHIPRGCQVVALTATATGAIRRDIASRLAMRNPLVVVTGFDRPNIRWSVVCSANRRLMLSAAIHRTRGAVIAYAITRRSAVLWADWLNRCGCPTSAYHGGMARFERSRAQAEWLSGATSVMVATSAFGMGIDRPDVRLVVHLGMPGRLSAYYQEAGRAGRDGNDAHALLLQRKADVLVQRAMIERSYREAVKRPSRYSRAAAWRARASAIRNLDTMVRYVSSARCRRHLLLTHFGEVYPGPCYCCDNCVSSSEIRLGRSDKIDGEAVGRVIREGKLKWRSLPTLRVRHRRAVRELLYDGSLERLDDLDGHLALR